MKNITLLILSFERANYLDKLLEEITNQLKILGFPKNVNIHIRINPSRISYDFIYRKYEKYSFISINENPTNIGAYNSLIKSIKEIKTDYLWWIGDDDNIYPGAIKKIISYLDEGFKFILLNFDRYRLVDNQIINHPPILPKRKLSLNSNPLKYLPKVALDIGLISSAVYEFKYYRNCLEFLLKDFPNAQSLNYLHPLCISLLSINNEKKIKFVEYPLVRNFTNEVGSFYDGKDASFHLINGIKKINFILDKYSKNRIRTKLIKISLYLAFLKSYGFKKFVSCSDSEISNFLNLILKFHTNKRLFDPFFRNLLKLLRKLIIFSIKMLFLVFPKFKKRYYFLMK